MNLIIETKDLSFSYENEDLVSKVLRDVNIKVRQGEFVAILGHNGSGKSTLAKHFNALLLPTGGAVFVDGIDTSNDDMVFEIRRKVGMVFQNPDNQFVATTVVEDVAFAPENLGVPSEEIRERVDSALKEVGMFEYREHAPHQLSGGQKQRVAVAGILAMRPKCIVLDEATAMLDPKGRGEVLKTVMQLNKEHGTTVLHITHFMEEAVHAGRVIVIDDGRILFDDTPKRVFSNVDELKSAGLAVPQVTELARLLAGNGLPVATDILTESECLLALKQVLS